MGSATRNDAYAELVSAYWRPVYRALRQRCRRTREEAEDLTQAFFLHLLEKKTLEHFVADPGAGRFRSLLRSLLARFVATADRDAKRLKRGGGQRHVRLDPAALEALEGRIARESPADPFDAEWRTTLIEQAMKDMAGEARSPLARRRLEVFLAYEVEPEDGVRPTYAALARKLGIKGHDVKNDLVTMRRRFAELVLDRIREEVRSEEEAREELQVLFGVKPPDSPQ
jgi:RNA polymerase sigma factor (sigma-70 family)